MSTAIVACARCGQTWDPATERPDCLAVPGRRCTAGDGQTAVARAEALAEELAGVPDRPIDVDPVEPAEPPDPEPADDEPAEQTDDDAGEEPARPVNAGHFKPGNRARKAGTGRNYDWTAAKKRYVEGVKTGETVEWPTLPEVAAHFGYPENRTFERSSAEGWVAERRTWQARVEEARRMARANALAKEGVNLDNSALSAAKVGLQLAMAKLTEVGNAHNAQRSAAGPGGTTTTTAIDALEQTRLAQAVDLWHKIGLRAIGDPETHRVELTGPGGERLEISQELRRDDPSRLAGVLGVLAQAGLGDLFGDPDDAERTLAARRGEDGVYSTDEAGG